MLFHADSAHMLGMNIFLKRLVLQWGKTKALERLRLYFGRLRGGSNGKSLWPGFSTIELKVCYIAKRVCCKAYRDQTLRGTQSMLTWRKK